MATAPWFVISPNTLLSIIGLIRGPDKTVPTPNKDWHNAVVDVVIPAYKEEDNIILALTSIARQTFKPRNVIVVDDGGKDRYDRTGPGVFRNRRMNVTVIERETSIGETPTIKRGTRVRQTMSNSFSTAIHFSKAMTTSTLRAGAYKVSA